MNNLLSSDILYDKIIDVELQRISMETQIRTILSVSKNPVDTSGLKGKYTSKGGMPIAIYEGFTHREFIRNTFGKLQGTTVEAEGITLQFSINDDSINWWEDSTWSAMIEETLQDLNANKLAEKNSQDTWTKIKKTPFGDVPSVFPSRRDVYTGCRIIVNKDGKQEKFHAVYLQEDEESTAYYHVKDSTKISCTKGGYKPQISFTTNVIPGNNCYKMILKITNLNLDYDIREVKRVKVMAGYRTDGFRQTFICPVFSSYIESPNPDGVTVFECLCVGSTESFSRSAPIKLKYIGGSSTIGNFIEKIATVVGINHNCLLEIYNNLDIKITGSNIANKTTYAENAAALIQWARKLVQKRIALAEGFAGSIHVNSAKSYPYVMMHMTSDGLYTYCVNRPNDDIKTTTNIPKDVVVLDAVKGATFNGVALTVKALWNPRVRPGELFEMQANVYNGANLPNTLTEDQFGKSKAHGYMYRCITCSISFSTNGSENEMSIMAVPIRYMETETPVDQEYIMSFAKFIQFSQSNYDLAGAGSNYIEIGDPDETKADITPTKKKLEVVSKNINAMFSIDLSTLFTTTLDYVIQEGDNLSALAYWYFMKGNYRCDFNIVPKDPASLPVGVNKGELSSRAFMWPIIAVLTYNYYKKTEASKVSSNPYETMRRLQNPDMIRVGKHLIIPTIEDFETLAKCKDVFKYALQAWTADSFPSYYSWGVDWARAYQYLGGTLNAD